MFENALRSVLALLRAGVRIEWQHAIGDQEIDESNEEQENYQNINNER